MVLRLGKRHNLFPPKTTRKRAQLIAHSGPNVASGSLERKTALRPCSRPSPGRLRTGHREAAVGLPAAEKGLKAGKRHNLFPPKTTRKHTQLIAHSGPNVAAGSLERKTALRPCSRPSPAAGFGQATERPRQACRRLRAGSVGV